MSTRARLRVLVGAAAALAAHACSSAPDQGLPPHGEALIFVDTDLAVPTLASRLRLDLYDESGRWFESRDIGRSDPRDWPASFSVFSDDDTRERRVIVRLRAYPEGSTRDYLGERHVAKTPYREPEVAGSVAELCASPPELRIGERVTMREGGDVITPHLQLPGCSRLALGGSVAARVTIARQGTYRFAVAGERPWISHTTLSLRTRCDDPGSQIACREAVLDGSALWTAGHFPRFDAELEPGTYFVVTTGMTSQWPADVTLEVFPTDLPLPPAVPQAEAVTEDARAPRLRRRDDTGAFDATPRSEPMPSAAVDRLLLVRLVPGRRDRLHVVLRGSCAGTMAKLGADPRSPDPKTATTCIDGADQMSPLVDAAPVEVLPPASEQGTFGTGQPCEPGASTPDRVCIPGGAFVMGTRLQAVEVATERKTTPERITAVSRFWMDRHEFTVARARSAVARGLAVDQRSLRVNEGPLRPDLVFSQPDKACTWSRAPLGREDYALSCVTWSLARALCQAEGGDLPTEAQWEYAAAAAGRPFKALYSWGNDAAECDRAVIERAEPACERPDGTRVPLGPVPAAAAAAALGPRGDVTPLGVVGLAGNLAEWVRDGADAYDGPCWSAAPVRDPTCDERNAPNRGVRGGSWMSSTTAAASRLSVSGGYGGSDPRGLFSPGAEIGFRCVYGAPR